MTEDRKALHAYVTRQAHDLWHDSCAEEGVSVSGLLESLAPRLDHILNDTDLVREARKVDAARRRRKGGPRQ